MTTETSPAARWPEHDAREREQRFARRWPWLLPLAAGIFLGGATLEMLPQAFGKAGPPVWLWTLGGLALFVLVHNGLNALGRRGLASVATFGIWLHCLLEGAVVATSYSVSLLVGLLVSAGMILHLIPEVAAVIALLGAAGLSFRQALLRNAVTWLLLIAGFLVVYLLLPGVAPSVLGGLLALGAGGFLYLAYLSWQERQWGIGRSTVAALVGVAVVGTVRLLQG